jgi:hypothetical protein
MCTGDRDIEDLLLWLKELSDDARLVSESVVAGGLLIMLRRGWNASVQRGRCIVGLWTYASE